MIDFFRELYAARSLVRALVVRNLAVRYRGSSLGFVWTLLNPLALMAIYTLVFKYYIRFNSVPHYSVFMFCGLLPWAWFTQSVSESTMSVVGSGHLVTKSLFPAQVLIVVPCLSGAVNFLLSLPVLFLFLYVSGIGLSFSVLALVLLIPIQIILLVGLGLFLGSLNVRLRDVQHIVGHVLSFLFFLCPIVYPVSSIPEKFRFTFELNPFAQLIGLYHKVLYYQQWPGAFELGYVLVSALLVGTIGILVFQAKRETFAELL